MVTYRVFHLPLTSEPPQEIPVEWLQLRGWLDAENVHLLRGKAIEIAPGVRAAVLGTGHYILPGGPDGKVHAGAKIIVWTEEADAGR